MSLSAKVYPSQDGIGRIDSKVVIGAPTDAISETSLPRIGSTSSHISRIVSDPVFKKVSHDFRRFLTVAKQDGNDGKKLRRKSMTLPSIDPTTMSSLSDSTNIIIFPEEVAGDDSLVLKMLNQVSGSINELKSGSESAWLDLSSLSASIMNYINERKTAVELKSLMEEHHYSLENGWDSKIVKIDILLNSLATLYMAEKARDSNASDSELKVKNIQALSFCPNTLFGNFPPEFKSKPCSTGFQAAVLLADISGFSKFAGQACLRGARGLDVLHRVTSEFLGLFVKTVYDYEGDVIAFAGDALVCIFPSFNKDNMDLACSQAIRCAYSLKEHKMNSLSAHFAISCGPIQFALLGGVNDEWTYLMNGACISQLTTCIDNAPPMHVACTQTCIDSARALYPQIESKCLPAGCHLIEGIGDLETAPTKSESSALLVMNKANSLPEFSTSQNGSFQANVIRSAPSHSFNSTVVSVDQVQDALEKMIKKASSFIPRPVMNALSTGSLNGIAELRNITTMFLNLDSYSLKDNVDPLTLQPFFVLLQEVLVKSGGFLRQFLIDDKGCVAIAMWGIPSYTHTNDCYRGLYCAWNMLNRVSELNHKVSIGLTTGHAYCGIVGSTLRRDYAGIGDKVNIAARLMAKAKGKVLVDPEVYAALDNAEKRSLVPYMELQLKGMANPITPYMFTADADLSVLRDNTTEQGTNTIIRQEVLKKILSVLDDSLVGTPFLSALRALGPDDEVADMKSAVFVDTVLDDGSEEKEKGVAAEGSDTPGFSILRQQTLGSKRIIKLADDETSVRSLGGSKKRSVLGLLGQMGGSDTAQSVAKLDTSTPPLKHNNSVRRRSVGGLNLGRALDENTVTYLPKQNNIIILSGITGTGKSTAAHFFRNSALRRKLRVPVIKCRPEDETKPFALAKKMFWEIAGASKYNSLEAKRLFINDLLSQIKSEDSLEFTPSDTTTLLFHEILIDSTELNTFTPASQSQTLGNSPKRPTSKSMTPLRMIEDIEEEELSENSFLYRANSANSSDYFEHSIADNSASEQGDSKFGRTSSKLLSLIASANPEEIKYFYSFLLDTILSNFPGATALTIEEAHFFDEESLKLLQAVQLKRMKLVVLLTIQKMLVEEIVEDTVADIPENEIVVKTGCRDVRSVGSSEVELVLAKSTLNMASQDSATKSEVNVSIQSSNESEHVYVRSAAYKQILNNSGTIFIEMKPLSVPEVQLVFKKLFSHKPVEVRAKSLATGGAILKTSPSLDNSMSTIAEVSSSATRSAVRQTELVPEPVVTENIPLDLIKKVITMTSGNAFWVKVIGKFIRETSVQDFVKMTNQGSAVDCLKNLIICRLEKVTMEQQVVIKYASVIGQRFSVRSLAEIMPEAIVPRLSQSLLVLSEMGFIQCIEETPLAIFGFHNKLTRDTIYDIMPLSDVTEIHLAVAQYLETKYTASLRSFYEVLGYHYCSARGQHEQAFKYTVKAADFAVKRKFFLSGLDNLRVAASLIRSQEEANVVLDVINRSVRELARIVDEENKKSLKFSTGLTPLVLGNRKANQLDIGTGAPPLAANALTLKKYRDIKNVVDNISLQYVQQSRTTGRSTESLRTSSGGAGGSNTDSAGLGGGSLSSSPVRNMSNKPSLKKRQLSFLSGIDDASAAPQGPLRWQLSGIISQHNSLDEFHSGSRHRLESGSGSAQVALPDEEASVTASIPFAVGCYCGSKSRCTIS